MSKVKAEYIWMDGHMPTQKLRSKSKVMNGPINSLDEVFSDKQIIHRGMKLSLDGIPSIRSPIRFSESELNLDKPSPKLGEHNSVIFPDN